MEQFKSLLPLILSGNIAENWRRWEQRFSLYMTATGADEKDENVKIAILLHTIGEEALEVYNTLTIDYEDEENRTMQEILHSFKQYYRPQKNIVFERHQFWSHTIADGFSVDTFVTELRQKSKGCEFGQSENYMIRDKLVFSLTDTRMKERLLRETGLTLVKALDICRAAEAAKNLITVMQTGQMDSEAAIQVIRKSKRCSGKMNYKSKEKNNNQHAN